VLRCISSSNSVQPFPLPCFVQESILVTSRKKMLQVHSISALNVFHNKRCLLHDVESFYLKPLLTCLGSSRYPYLELCSPVQNLVLFMQPVAVYSLPVLISATG